MAKIPLPPLLLVWQATVGIWLIVEGDINSWFEYLQVFRYYVTWQGPRSKWYSCSGACHKVGIWRLPIPYSGKIWRGLWRIAKHPPNLILPIIKPDVFRNTHAHNSFSTYSREGAYVSEIEHKQLTFCAVHGLQQRYYASQVLRMDPRCL